VLHRNELSGSLGGLTRVRRFVQDDAHVFCRKDQIQAEVLAALQFMKFVYDVLGMTYKLELSTRPLKALGEVSVWNEAEAALAAAMNEFAGEGNWKENPGDGAFYGPKIDIKVWGALSRCALSFRSCPTPIGATLARANRPRANALLPLPLLLPAYPADPARLLHHPLAAASCRLRNR
jgi:hypothetical protein